MAKHPPPKRVKPDLKPSTEDADTVRISVLLTKEQRQRLKVLAASRGVTISEVVREGIARFLGSES